MEEKEQKPWWQPGLIMFGRFSAWIFAPVILGAFLGKWLDRKFNMEPFLFLSTVGLAFFISMFGLIMEVSKEYKKAEGYKSDKIEQKDHNKNPE
jgi:F0F1-type ATP synthase assembly protein I